MGFEIKNVGHMGTTTVTCHIISTIKIVATPCPPFWQMGASKMKNMGGGAPEVPNLQSHE
jgi:hypothetical protein